MLNLTHQMNAMTIKRRYAILDVFTQTPLAGNPLAVVLDSDGLDTLPMQAIAAEFNLSETVFVSPPSVSTHRASLRIFTPAYELPFAGHPTIGTAIYLALQDQFDAAQHLILEAPVGPIICDVTTQTGGGSACFILPKLPQPVPLTESAAQIAAALMLNVDDIGTDSHHPTIFGAGNAGFLFVPVRNRHALARAQLSPLHWQTSFAHLIGVYIYTSDTGDADIGFRSRMVDLAIGEDPATGSAVAAFAGVLAKFESLADGDHGFRIGQGFEMGRPSLIDLQMTLINSVIAQASISGHAVVVAEGTLYA
jgi:trans-2,3-dihydro-3-hydroxyanthranilate isomerase